MKRIANHLLLGMFVLISIPVMGQQTMSRTNPGETYRMGVELFYLEKYASAKDLMLSVVEQARRTDPMMTMNASFYAAVSSARLAHRDAVRNLQQFILDFPESARRIDALMELADVFYVNQDWGRAIEIYTQIDPLDLPEERRVEYHFKRGYSHFMLNQMSAAKPHFARIRHIESRYRALASYYYAHILHTEGNFQSALLEFEQLREDEVLGAIVPFYIMQIYHKQGRHNLIIEQAPALIERASPRRAVELSRLIGEAYYNEGRFAEALPHLRLHFERAAVRPTREDDYVMGFTFYNLQKYDSAAIFFQRVVSASTQRDLLKQNALYHLGDIYIKLGQHRAAQAAFLDASRIDVDPRIQENAFLNYARLSYQLSPSPFNEALRAVQAFLERYPNSRHADELHGLLVAMFSTTRNFRDAHAAISMIQRRDPRLIEAHQRIAFNLGVELFNETRFAEAQKLFDEAIEIGFDQDLTLRAFFWKGEAYFRMGLLQQALMYYERALFSTRFQTMPEYPLAAYGAGYVNFLMNNFSQAVRYFTTVVQNRNQVSVAILNDTYLRLGDAFYMQRMPNEALRNYELAIQLNQPDRDYALLQRAVVQGVLGRTDARIATLQIILNEHPNSPLIPRALNELASSHLVLSNDARALEYFQMLSTNHPRSSLGKVALLRQGLIHFNAGRNDEAIAVFERVVVEHPGTAEAREALMSLRNIYIALNRANDFFAFVNRIGANINEDAQDSIAFSAAENRYLEGDCLGAMPSLRNYLERFPEGIFVTEATFYLADCEMRGGNMQQARRYFLAVIARPESVFTERSIINAARISFDLNDFQEASRLFTLLAEFSEVPANINMAIIAILRSEIRLGNDQNIITAARNVLNLEQLSDDIRDEANHAIATSAQRLGQNQLATETFALLRNSRNSEFAAQARYFEIESLFANGEFDLAEQRIFEFISEVPSSQYFLARSYIIWGRIYAERGNFLQARQTFQSIIDNYDVEDDGIIETSRRELQNVLDREAQIRADEDRRRATEGADEDEIISIHDFF
ncbi:MAG: tetratricopeptide repeat protein [Bacteroidales bacterium]|nr:tetratricopeptide repeat protein [Bacteroidales bacterium]